MPETRKTSALETFSFGGLKPSQIANLVCFSDVVRNCTGIIKPQLRTLDNLTPLRQQVSYPHPETSV